MTKTLRVAALSAVLAFAASPLFAGGDPGGADPPPPPGSQVTTTSTVVTAILALMGS
jgi:hypothetical protein